VREPRASGLAKCAGRQPPLKRMRENPDEFPSSSVRLRRKLCSHSDIY
jgi:hypothetical protein